MIVRRRGAKDVALVPADALASLMETACLLRSPTQRERTVGSAASRKQGKGKPESVEKLRREMGLDASA